MNIEELITSGQKKLDEQEVQIAAAQAQAAAKKESERQSMIEQFMADVRASIPDYLWPYIVTESDDNPGWEPCQEGNVTVRIPKCADVVFRMRRNYNPDRANGRTCDYTWFRPGKEPVYRVNHATELYMDYEFDKWVIRYDSMETSDIEIALAWARNEFVAADAMYSEAEKRNEKIKDDLRAAKANEETRAQFRAERERVEHEQRAELVADLVRDPVAFRLLQAMAEISKSRDAWQEQLDLADMHLEEMNEAHDDAIRRVTERANEQIHRAGREAEEARRSAEDARRSAEDARDEADRIQKKLRQAERGL